MRRSDYLKNLERCITCHNNWFMVFGIIHPLLNVDTRGISIGDSVIQHYQSVRNSGAVFNSTSNLKFTLTIYVERRGKPLEILEQ